MTVWCACRGGNVDAHLCGANASGCEGLFPEVLGDDRRGPFMSGFMAGLRGNPVDEDFEGQAEEAWSEYSARRPSPAPRPTEALEAKSQPGKG